MGKVMRTRRPEFTASATVQAGGGISYMGAEQAAGPDESWVQIGTRVPQRLRRAVKLHCAEVDVSIRSFIIAAIRDKLTPGSDRRRTDRSV